MSSGLLSSLILLSFWSVLFFSQARADSSRQTEEMHILRMFYTEKDLMVVSATRNPKPLSRTAENVSVVTAREIDAMNAHTIAEVLNRVTGVFVNFNQDFGASSLINIQGSESRHVLVLLDGIPWNFLSGGSAETNSIPVGIIDRIEIIKGPASSSWGSALGGVINVITKPTGDTGKPHGSLRTSYGKKGSQDHRAEVSGKAGSAGYYLFAGRLESDGFLPGREFEENQLYSKFHIPLSETVEAGFTAGFTRPDLGLGDFPSNDISSRTEGRSSFLTGFLNAFLARDLQLKISMYGFDNETEMTNRNLGLAGPAGALFLQSFIREKSQGANARLVWSKGRHEAVLGADIDRGKVNHRIRTGADLQALGSPEAIDARPSMDQWAIYLNDTISFDRWSVTPGIRYDKNSITGSFVSPSLGVTRELGSDSLLRASVARGFTVPPLSATQGGGLFLDPNPALEQEEVWSYQAGIESGALRGLRLKATVFRYDLDQAIERVLFGGGPPIFNDIAVNSGSIRRQGFEIEGETLPFHGFSLLPGYAHVDIDPPQSTGSEKQYSLNLGFRYRGDDSFYAELFGHYIWWNTNAFFEADYDDFLWDLNVLKKLFTSKGLDTELFFTVHNLFSGNQFAVGDSPNPDRWIEAGLRLRF